PSGTTIWPILPSSTASTSMVALSVSISQMTCPALTESPALTCHAASLPSVMVGDSAGIRILIDMRTPPSAVADRAGGLDNVFRRGQGEALEVRRIGHRHFEPIHPLDRRTQPVERLLHHLRRKFRADPRKGPALLDGNEPVGLLDRVHDGVGIQ